MFPIFANDDGITFCLDKINLLFIPEMMGQKSCQINERRDVLSGSK